MRYTVLASAYCGEDSSADNYWASSFQSGYLCSSESSSAAGNDEISYAVTSSGSSDEVIEDGCAGTVSDSSDASYSGESTGADDGTTV